MKRLLTDNSGFTIMEVLIASIVFMAGFSIMVALLSSTLAKFSSRELVLANNVAREQMISAVSIQETTALDTTVERSGMSFEFKRQITVDNGLAKVRIAISRKRTDRKLVDLYYEYKVL